AVIFVPEPLRCQFADLGLRAKNLAIIPGEMDTALFHPPNPEERQEELARIASWIVGPTRKHLLLFVGRVVPEKGVHVLISACQEIFEADSESSVLIVGLFDTSPNGQAF